MISPGSFPFGWLRNYNNDNWQILWNKDSRDIILKSINTKELRKIHSASKWIEAKRYSDKIIKNPKLLDK